MRMPWRSNRLVLFAAVLFVGLASLAVWVKGEFYPEPIEGVCRSLAEGHDYAAVPGDVLEEAAETSDVRLRDLEEPSVEQLEAARAEMLSRRGMRDDTVSAYSACLVDYSRTGRAADPEADPPVAAIIQRKNVPALLLYRESAAPVSPCFGFDCGEDEPTYITHCALFADAATGRVLRLEGCWGDPPTNNFVDIQD
jgi:hypothetical protein